MKIAPPKRGLRPSLWVLVRGESIEALSLFVGAIQRPERNENRAKMSRSSLNLLPSSLIQILSWGDCIKARSIIKPHTFLICQHLTVTILSKSHYDFKHRESSFFEKDHGGLLEHPIAPLTILYSPHLLASLVVNLDIATRI